MTTKDKLINRANFLAETMNVPQRVAQKLMDTREGSGHIEFKNMDGETPEILIYEQIGLDWWTGEGVTAKGFNEQLSQIKASEIVVRINSPGGDVWDGMAIYNMLAQHNARVTVAIEGIAASAASFIAMAGDRIEMLKTSQMMIHSAWTVAAGNAHDMREIAEVLEKVDGQIASLYETQSGHAASEWIDLMAKDNYYTAEEALELGLVDAVISPAESKPEPASNSVKPPVRNSGRKRQISLRKATISL